MRAVRVRFFKLIEKFKKHEKEDARASGIQGEDFDEIYRGLTDINQRMEEVKPVGKRPLRRKKKRRMKIRKKHWI